MIRQWIFRNARGQEVVVGHHKPFWLERYSGIDSMGEAEFSTFNIRHGVKISHKRLKERPMELEGKVTDKTMLPRLQTACANMMDGELIIGNRAIACTVQSCELTPPAPGEVWWSFLISLLAPYPYFHDTREITDRIVSWNKRLKFPITFPRERTFMFGSRDDTGQTTARNDGQVECPCVVRIAARESVQNPRISIVEAGTELAFNYAMAAGDVIEVDTFALTVELNGVKNYAILARDSVFLLLPEGESVIKYAADAGAMAMEVDIRYRPHYAGGIEH